MGLLCTQAREPWSKAGKLDHTRPGYWFRCWWKPKHPSHATAFLPMDPWPFTWGQNYASTAAFNTDTLTCSRNGWRVSKQTGVQPQLLPSRSADWRRLGVSTSQERQPSLLGSWAGEIRQWFWLGFCCKNISIEK